MFGTACSAFTAGTTSSMLGNTHLKQKELLKKLTFYQHKLLPAASVLGLETSTIRARVAVAVLEDGVRTSSFILCCINLFIY